jgi:hypothetical protein
MKTLVVVYDPPRTPLLGLLGPLAPFFLLQPLCGGDISTTVNAYSENTGIMFGIGSRQSGGASLSPGDLTRLFINFLINFYTVQRERKQIRESIYYNDTTL